MHVDGVGNKLDLQVVVKQGSGQDTRRAMVHGVHGVENVRDMGYAVADGLLDRSIVRKGVADRADNSAEGRFSDDVQRAGQFRRDGHDLDGAIACFDKFMERCHIRMPEMLEIHGAAQFGIEVRAFHVYARNVRVGVFANVARQQTAIAEQPLFGLGMQTGQHGCGSMPKKVCGGGGDAVHRFVAESESAAAMGEQVDKARHDHAAVGIEHRRVFRHIDVGARADVVNRIAAHMNDAVLNGVERRDDRAARQNQVFAVRYHCNPSLFPVILPSVKYRPVSIRRPEFPPDDAR